VVRVVLSNMLKHLPDSKIRQYQVRLHRLTWSNNGDVADGVYDPLKQAPSAPLESEPLPAQIVMTAGNPLLMNASSFAVLPPRKTGLKNPKAVVQ